MAFARCASRSRQRLQALASEPPSLERCRLRQALPDSVIDAALKTDDVLDRTIDDLDLRELLANVDDQDDLNRQVEAAVTQAVKDSLVDRLLNLLCAGRSAHPFSGPDRR